MPQFDQAHDWTDEQIERISRNIKREFSQARRELSKKLEEWPEKLEEERKELARQLKEKEITRRQYNRGLMRLQTHEKWLNEMVHAASVGTMSTTERAMSIVNDEIPGVTAYAMNYSTYAIERDARVNTMWNLVDGDTVNLLFEGERQLLPFVDVDGEKVMSWNNQHFQSALTQGILQGESIPDIAKRLQSVITMSESQSVRAARTACTGAENAGRTRAYQRANSMGIEVLSEWRATLDTRTRLSHRVMNGQRVKPGEVFSNGCIEPGDPNGPGEEVWNCRCALVPYVVGTNYGKNDGQWFRDETIEDMTYEEWVAGKDLGIKTDQGHVIAEGKDILGTWKRRPDQFDFEIEDVMDAQGFMGVPRVVSAEEFDQAVKAANGGNGLIMQRTYTGPDKEIADSYREMLYNGKWYVDCSTGGAQYGQGMYAAADYTGTLTEGIRAEMQHYIDLGKHRYPVTTFDMLTEDRQRRMIAEQVEAMGLSGEAAEAARAVIANEMQLEHLTWDQMVKAHEAMGGADYTKALSNLREYRTESVAYVETMTLDPSAKVVKYSDLRDMRWNAWDEHKKDWTDEQKRQFQEMNDGSFAVSLGYDAINAEGHGESGSYTVVLNRTKLIIRRPE